MDKNKAITILIQAVEVATQKGAFGLTDAGIIYQAVQILKTSEPKPEPKVEKKDK